MSNGSSFTTIARTGTGPLVREAPSKQGVRHGRHLVKTDPTRGRGQSAETEATGVLPVAIQVP